MAKDLTAKKTRGQGIKWVPTEVELQDIEKMAGVGVIMKEIAASIGINTDTLCNNEQASNAASRGRAIAIRNACGKFYKRLWTDEGDQNIAGQLFWLKCNAHWKEASDQPQTNINILQLTAENYGKIQEIARTARQRLTEGKPIDAEIDDD